MNAASPVFVVSRETRVCLDRLTDLVLAEAAVQNLIAASTISDFRNRHIDDSLQLLSYVQSGDVLDIGSGAGFPGLVIAVASQRPVTLVEPRRRRAEFLQRAVAELGVSEHTNVLCSRVERVDHAPFSNITARAVASLDGLFAAAIHLADLDTLWVLPKGRSAPQEVEQAARTWQGEFELVMSATDPEASIVVARGIRRRCG